MNWGLLGIIATILVGMICIIVTIMVSIRKRLKISYRWKELSPPVFAGSSQPSFPPVLYIIINVKNNGTRAVTVSKCNVLIKGKEVNCYSREDLPKTLRSGDELELSVDMDEFERAARITFDNLRKCRFRVLITTDNRVYSKSFKAISYSKWNEFLEKKSM